MAIYNFYAIDKDGRTLGFAQSDTVEAAKMGMLALGYKYFPQAMSTAEELVLRYQPCLRQDFPDIRLSMKDAKQIFDKTMSDKLAYDAYTQEALNESK